MGATLWMGCGAALVVFVLVIAAAVVGIYNRLIVLRNRVDNAWAQIDVQLKRRYDLIPNLVETVKGYAAHETGTLQKVTEARTAAMNASGIQEQTQAENMLSSTLRSLFALAEAYPDLKANQNFLGLQEELSGTESKIAYARQFYNDSVMSYDTAIQTFPNSLLAGAFSFGPREYFEIELEARETPKVSFS